MTQPSFAAAGIRLRKLLSQELRSACPADLRVTSCTSDWRTIRPGDAFVAITGDDEDGHDHAMTAVELGASAVICERPLPVFGVPQCLVADSRVAFGRLCQALVGNPSRHMKVIGVTGSHGKTSVVRLLAEILRDGGARVGTLDSYGYWDGLEERPPHEGDFTAPSLARSLAEMAASGVTHAVVEVSSRDLARKTFSGVTLDAACITNLGRRDLELHGSVENYRNATRQILEHLEDSGVAVLNVDDAASIEVLNDLMRPVLTFGMKGLGEISAQVIEQFVNEQTFLLSAGDDTVAARTEIVGDHHIYNCLAAVTTALAYGVELGKSARAIQSICHLPGQMDRVMCGQDFAVVVDAADSAEALRHCLRTARQVTTGRVICVFGAAVETEISELPAIGRVIGSLADVAAITNGGPAELGSHRNCLEIRSGFPESRKAQVILDRREAIQWALSEATAGDTVVIAGMGAEPHTPLGSECMLACDREIAETALRNAMPVEPLRLAA